MHTHTGRRLVRHHPHRRADHKHRARLCQRAYTHTHAYLYTHTQDIGWFDTIRTGELTTSIERDCVNVQAAIGQKVAIFAQNMTTFLGGIVIGFTQGWELTLVLMASLPILAGAGAWLAVSTANLTTQGEKAYRGAGAVAEQVMLQCVCMHG
jgi:ABC-type multidrug transport system fused ATPase/permease subunit